MEKVSCEKNGNICLSRVCMALFGIMKPAFAAWNIVCFYSLSLPSKVTTPQDAHRRLVLQVFLGSNTLELSAIHR